jgi:hypothetical protein
MEHLLKKLDESFDDAEGSIHIVDADWIADDLRINVSLQLNDDSEAELWEISCVGVVEESIRSGYVSNLHVQADSPLLKPYTEMEVDLMFSENECPPALLLGVITSSCVEVMGRPEYIQRFMNQRATVTGIASSRYGKLGRFPKSIAAGIVSALSGQPICVNSLPVSVPRRWTGAEFVSYPMLQVLSIGESYVIAEHFSAVRV